MDSFLVLSNGHDKSALFIGYGVNEAEPLIVEISEQNQGEQRQATSHRQRRHQSVNNVKPVAFEFKIWAVNMLSARWEHGACAAALMLRADIRQFSIVRRSVNEDITRNSPYVAGRHSLDHVNHGTFTAIENSLLSCPTQCISLQTISTVPIHPIVRPLSAYCHTSGRSS